MPNRARCGRRPAGGPARGRHPHGGIGVCQPKLYTTYADWWPIFSPPEGYRDEALIFKDLLLTACPAARTVLELGSGGGNTARYMKQYFDLTLVDLSPRMVEVSRRLNPECRHHVADMTVVNLGRQFDAVFIHDAIMYMTTIAALERAVATAYRHTRPGGCALFVPDFFRETFRPSTQHGCHRRGTRTIWYLESWGDCCPDDDRVEMDLSYIMSEGGEFWAEHERHVCGCFRRETWREVLRRCGFIPEPVTVAQNVGHPWEYTLWRGVRP